MAAVIIGVWPKNKAGNKFLGVNQRKSSLCLIRALQRKSEFIAKVSSVLRLYCVSILAKGKCGRAQRKRKTMPMKISIITSL